MNYKKTAIELMDHLGGSENVVNATHCMTRLRLSFKDIKKVNKEAVEQINGVLGSVLQGSEYQIIIGTDVDKVHDEVINIIKNNEDNTEGKFNGNIFSYALDLMSAALSPLIPVIMGAAFISILLAISSQFGIITPEAQTYQVLSAISNSVYYFFPILVAFTLSNRINTNPVFAVVVASFLLFPDFISLFGEEAVNQVSVFGIPIMFVSYSKQIFPVFFAVLFQKQVEKIVYKIVPKSLKIMFASGIILVITIVFTITIFGPIGGLLTELINKFLYFLVDNLGWVAIPIFAFINPVMLGTGLGSAVFPIMLTSIVANGFEALVLPAALAGNAAQVGAGLAVAMKTKNPELKAISIEGAIAALLGVTEPIIFSVHYKLKRTFISVMIASGLAAIIPGIAGVKVYALANGIFSLPAYLPGGNFNFIMACVSLVAGIVIGFIVVSIIGFNDLPLAESKIEIDKEPRSNKSLLEILSPINGSLIDISKVEDTAFSSEIVGKGVAIIPSEGMLYAPVDGTIVTLFPTNHAIGIKTEEGHEILIHIGFDSINLQEGFFTNHVKIGDTIKRNDLLISFNLEEGLSNNTDLTTSIVITNHDDFLDMFVKSEKTVTINDVIITVLN